MLIFNLVLLRSDEDSCKSFVPYVLTLVAFKQPLEISSKNCFTHDKQRHGLNFNPGLTLIGFRTTGPWSAVYHPSFLLLRIIMACPFYNSFLPLSAKLTQLVLLMIASTSTTANRWNSSQYVRCPRQNRKDYKNTKLNL